MKIDLGNLPYWIDRWRLWPRAMITTYIWILIEVSFWFMGLPIPTPSQAGFASAVLGIGAAWFGIYVQNPSVDKILPVPYSFDGDGPKG